MTSTRAGNEANGPHSPNSVRSDSADHGLIPNRRAGRRMPQTPPAAYRRQTAQPRRDLANGPARAARTEGRQDVTAPRKVRQPGVEVMRPRAATASPTSEAASGTGVLDSAATAVIRGDFGCCHGRGCDCARPHQSLRRSRSRLSRRCRCTTKWPAPTDGNIRCYDAAMRWQRKEHAERSPASTRLSSSRGEAAQGANYVDRNAVLRIGAALFESMPTPHDFVRKAAAPSLARYFYQPTGSEPNEYHKWYYNTQVFNNITWMGVKTQKSASDMWNYQEILFELKPSLVIEFGTNYGGSALFFANVMRQIGEPFKVLSVDVYHGPLEPAARRDSDITFLESRSTVPAVAEHIRRLRSEFPGKVFAILDSDHSMNHVLAEMKLLRPLLTAGDYLIS